jgi:hypothetical protein
MLPCVSFSLQYIFSLILHSNLLILYTYQNFNLKKKSYYNIMGISIT